MVPKKRQSIALHSFLGKILASSFGSYITKLFLLIRNELLGLAVLVSPINHAFLKLYLDSD